MCLASTSMCSLEMLIFSNLSTVHFVSILLIWFAADILQATPVLSWFSSKKAHEDAGSSGLRALALLGAGVTGLLSFSTVASADEAEHGLECPDYPWPHDGILSSYDHAS